jgi:hypothetical protein
MCIDTRLKSRNQLKIEIRNQSKQTFFTKVALSDSENMNWVKQYGNHFHKSAEFLVSSSYSPREWMEAYVDVSQPHNGTPLSAPPPRKNHKPFQTTFIDDDEPHAAPLLLPSTPHNTPGLGCRCRKATEPSPALRLRCDQAPPVVLVQIPRPRYLLWSLTPLTPIL